ncbi:hypothetical protein D9M71_198270 [compost metagenome]
MPKPGEWNSTAGRQRAVEARTGQVVVGGQLESFNVVIVEAGTAVREDYIKLDGPIIREQLAIPIMVVPGFMQVVATVGIAMPATMYWDDDASYTIWGVDEVHVEMDTATRQLSLISHIAEGGEASNFPRIAYHITIWLRGREPSANSIIELEKA